MGSSLSTNCNVSPIEEEDGFLAELKENALTWFTIKYQIAKCQIPKLFLSFYPKSPKRHSKQWHAYPYPRIKYTHKYSPNQPHPYHQSASLLALPIRAVPSMRNANQPSLGSGTNLI